MPYDNGNGKSAFLESFEDSDNIDRDFYSDDLSVRDGLLSPGIERSGESDEQEEAGEVQEYNSDYSDILGDIYSGVTYSNEQISAIVVQLDIQNENLHVINENLKIGVCLLFVLVVLFAVKIVYTIFNRILGLGNC